LQNNWFDSNFNQKSNYNYGAQGIKRFFKSNSMQLRLEKNNNLVIWSKINCHHVDNIVIEWTI